MIKANFKYVFLVLSALTFTTGIQSQDVAPVTSGVVAPGQYPPPSDPPGLGLSPDIQAALACKPQTRGQICCNRIKACQDTYNAAYASCANAYETAYQDYQRIYAQLDCGHPTPITRDACNRNDEALQRAVNTMITCTENAENALKACIDAAMAAFCPAP